jgi:hypothetical protein
MSFKGKTNCAALVVDALFFPQVFFAAAEKEM